jgi:transposase
VRADKSYDADWLRTDLPKNGITPVIPGKRGRKRRIRNDKSRYRKRWRIEAAFDRLEDFRGIATRYDKPDPKFSRSMAYPHVPSRFEFCSQSF